jgi:hypothetical protein
LSPCLRLVCLRRLTTPLRFTIFLAIFFVYIILVHSIGCCLLKPSFSSVYAGESFLGALVLKTMVFASPSSVSC